MNKKFKYFIPILVLLIPMFIIGCSKEEKPSDAFNKFKTALSKKDYKGMYAMLDDKSKSYITEKDFTDKYNNIYSSLESNNITATAKDLSTADKEKKDSLNIPFNLSMDSSFGKLVIDSYNLPLVKSSDKKDKDNLWKIQWSEKLIFPQMEKGEKVKIQRLTAQRGEIADRSQIKLAYNDKVASLGIHPKKFLPTKDASVQALASILDLSPDFINSKIKDADKKLDEFVPIVDVSLDEKDKLSKATDIAGVKYIEKASRVYNGGEAIGSLIGYVGSITSEELEKNKKDGYGISSSIGKAGLEQIFEKRLKGQDGLKLYISRKVENKDTEVVITKKDPVPGENIKLSIDLPLQQKVYTEMSGQKGASSAIDPKTGEVLSLVSSPSYDPNVFVTYKTNTIKTKFDASWKDMSDSRFNNSYAPGSIFKLVTASIGLNNKIIDPNETLDIKGTSWQKDSSWGGKKITTMVDPGKPINLRDALIYSHNIYFAQQALKIGTDKFVEGAKAFGIGEDFPFSYPMAKNQIANNNTIKNEELLADTGYGQGELLITPLQAAFLYSPVVNDGNIMTPILELNDKDKPKVWKEGAIKKENISILKDDLVAVVNSPSATASLAKIDGANIGGKTGTAELKTTQDDPNAKENSWFVGMNMDNPKIVVSMIMEDAKSIGGTKYLVPKVKNILSYSIASK
ncbi:penicillin-binding transpeptidase domain-containing protein [Clostridium manihotivorum]|uniref:Penicillin-binding transpeptidase domain-containing protein n=1 Tax=Clostridium manihotivorum TaxID=2320868 RepID=A0A3R5QWZ2_9CLOT|nr:penicillin-binding transpeptidase domain-containing protein [Clostridium manihotivorum]QAA34589.1 penicillin-binding transpeptidase domain-containing protein [Clostridium manihotivorum]